MGTEEPKQEPQPDEATGSDSAEATKKKSGIPRVNRKIPEPPGNLRQRAEWLRKRTGS
jgi:hypothetical protein